MVAKPSKIDRTKGYITVSRTSSLTNADGDSTARQKRATVLADPGQKVSRHICHLGVSGTIPLKDRPDIQNIVDDNNSKGYKTSLVFENESRLARGLRVQLDAMDWAEQNGVDLIHSRFPDLWVSKEPDKRCLSNILGALSELDWSNKLAVLKSGIKRKHGVTKLRTLKDNTKVEGRKNFKD
jgi:DNA invertase Pin-like site-specific DNA recombinase